jgi:hypothetical protein
LAYRFPETKARALVVEWQQTRSDGLFSDILTEIGEMIDKLIWASGLPDFMEVDEVRQILRIKLFRALPHFKPERGSKLFSFLSCVVGNQLCSIKKKSLKEASRGNVSFELLTALELEGLNRGRRIKRRLLTSGTALGKKISSHKLRLRLNTPRGYAITTLARIWIVRRKRSMSAPIYISRRGATKLFDERDYRTYMNRHDPEPDAFLIFGKKLTPLFLVERPEDKSRISQTKE